MIEERTGIITFQGNPLTLIGKGVSVGEAAPEFCVLANDLTPRTLADYKGKVLVISVVPSLDTPVCDMQTRRFNTEAAKLSDNVRILTISCDLNYRKNLWKYARIRTTTGFASGCVLLFFQSGVFCLCLAVQAAVCTCRRVGQREYLRKLLFHGGYAARVFAVDDIFDPRRELELALFHLLAVLDEVHRNARVNIADHVPVQIQNAVNFDDVLAAKLIADNIFEQRHRAIELVKIQYLI